MALILWKQRRVPGDCLCLFMFCEMYAYKYLRTFYAIMGEQVSKECIELLCVRRHCVRNVAENRLKQSSSRSAVFLKVKYRGTYGYHMNFFAAGATAHCGFVFCSPLASSLTRFLDHTQRRATVGRTPLDEWSVRRRDLYLTTHNTHNRKTSMSRWDSNPRSQQACGRKPTP